jgi:hypothetical protein
MGGIPAVQDACEHAAATGCNTRSLADLVKPSFPVRTSSGRVSNRLIPVQELQFCLRRLIEDALATLIDRTQEAVTLPQVGNGLLVSQGAVWPFVVHAAILPCFTTLVKHEKNCASVMSPAFFFDDSLVIISVVRHGLRA